MSSGVILHCLRQVMRVACLLALQHPHGAFAPDNRAGTWIPGMHDVGKAL